MRKMGLKIDVEEALDRQTDELTNRRTDELTNRQTCNSPAIRGRNFGLSRNHGFDFFCVLRFC